MSIGIMSLNIQRAVNWSFQDHWRPRLARHGGGADDGCTWHSHVRNNLVGEFGQVNSRNSHHGCGQQSSVIHCKPGSEDFPSLDTMIAKWHELGWNTCQTRLLSSAIPSPSTIFPTRGIAAMQNGYLFWCHQKYHQENYAAFSRWKSDACCKKLTNWFIKILIFETHKSHKMFLF